MDCLNIGADHVHSLTSNKTKLPSNYIEILKRKSPTQTKKKTNPKNCDRSGNWQHDCLADKSAENVMQSCQHAPISQRSISIVFLQQCHMIVLRE